MDKYLITVCTPTYNREHTLRRVFESLQNQKFDDFEWLVIDDGSIDNTRELIKKFKEMAEFSINYVYKENGGRHTALNLSYQHAKGKYIINIDSDDQLQAGALSKIHKIWNGIPKRDYDRYWCISGRCIDSETLEMVGQPYKNHINLLKGRRKKKEIYKTKGEKSCCRKKDVLVKYPFPVFNDTKFVTESMVWERINKDYDQYCVNDIFRIYFQNEPDSLGAGKVHSDSRRHSLYHKAVFYVNQCVDQICYNKYIIYEIINVSRMAILTNRSVKDVMKELNNNYKRIFVLIGYPISLIWLNLFKHKLRY